MLEQRVQAYVGEYGVPAVVHAVQGDTGRVLVFELHDYEFTGSETASLMCMRPDKSVFSYAGIVDAPNMVVSVAMDTEGGALTQAGVVACQLVLQDGGEVLCSYRFGIIVEEIIGGEATQEDIDFLAGLQAQLDAAIGRFVQSSLEINGHALTGNIQLTSADVGAVPTTRTVNGKALSNNITLQASDFAAAASTAGATGEVASLTYTVVSVWS